MRDINMPVMDGLTLLAELRARQSEVWAIIVSAYGDFAPTRGIGAFVAINKFDFATAMAMATVVNDLLGEPALR